jgi:tetratricopeptide (TPR) repeat protein
VATLLLGATGVARAERQSEAQRLLERGIEEFERGALDDARQTLRRAVELAPSRANPYRWLGLVEARMGRCEEAVRDLSTFIERAPAHDARAIEAATLRDRCEAELAARAAVPPPPPVASPEVAPSPTAMPSPPAAPPVADEGARRRRTILLGAAGGAALVGLGLLAGGIYEAAHGANLSDQLSTTTGAWGPSQNDAVADGNAANRNLGVLVGVGAAALVTAAVLTAVAFRSAPAARRTATTTTARWSF